MKQDLILANAQLVLPSEVVSGALYISDGKIAAVEPGDHLPQGAIDCQGDYLAPGLIELHTDNLERHIQPRPRVDWPHASAIIAHDAELAGTGITTVFDALRVGSVVSSNKTNYGKYARHLASELIHLRNQGALRIDHLIHLRAEVCSETLIEELAEFGPGDHVGLVSLMDHTPGQRQFRDLEKLRAYVCGKHGLSDGDFEDHVASRITLQEQLGAAHEAATVNTARQLGAVLASHDDTTAQHVARSADHGIRLAEFPTTAEAAQACRDAGIAVIMGAPNVIRSGSHSGNVSAIDLAKMGLLDIVSSDYIPSALLLSVFRLSQLWTDLPRAFRTATQTPAETCGLGDRGKLENGRRADIIRIKVLNRNPMLRGVWSHGERVS